MPDDELSGEDLTMIAEVDSLGDAWKDFNGTIQTDGPVHDPPSWSILVEVIRESLVDYIARRTVVRITEEGVPEDVANEEAATEVNKCRDNLLSIMFRFGQYTAKLDPPLLWEGLLPCDCGDLTEDDQKQLLNG